ncbi:carbohydrate ABC transporter permease [Actinokineospora sp. HUAS TT18]|uniref:carbohydrate ABC transporter permease n=1 Tax=Actinokineospora sp. HUAS TT18 TaxID=3447451 RepID=UPI003F5268A4
MNGTVTKRGKQPKSLGRVARDITVIGMALLWLVPTWLLVVNAFTSVETYTGSPRWVPDGFGFVDNLVAAWDAGDFGQATANSLGYAFVCAAAAVIVAAGAAFAVAIMPVRRPALWFWLIYTGTLLPLQVFVRPLFSASAELDLYDSWTGLAIVYTAICVPFAFFVIRNYLATVPREITEAALLDGASWWRVFRSVHLPLAKPAMAAAFIFQFVWVWNELLFGISLTFSPTARPIMAALADLSSGYSRVPPPVVLAAALAVSVPTVALFFAFQRLFVSSMRTNI